MLDGLLKSIAVAGDRFWLLIFILVLMDITQAINHTDESDDIRPSLYDLYTREPINMFITALFLVYMFLLAKI